MSPKKGMPVAALIGMAPEDGKEPADGDGEKDASRDDAKEAMELFIAAVHDRDTEGALSAYESLHNFCAGDEPEEKEEDEGETEEA